MKVQRWFKSWEGLSFAEALRRLYRLTGDLLAVLSVALMTLSLFVFVALDYYGERHWLIAILLYLPSVVWILPSLALLPFCALFRFRYALVLMVFIACYGVFFCGYQWGDKPLSPREGADFTLISNNVGNNGRTSISAFAETYDPDILVFQEALPARYYRETYSELNVHSDGEFALVTRFPILEAGLLESPRWGAVPIAARYVLETRSKKPLVIYNVHLPTRRFIMNGLKGKGLLSAMLGGSGGYGSQVRTQNRDFFVGQIQLTQALIQQAKQEKHAVLLVGDFNVPGKGFIYRQLVKGFADAFVEGGKGFGYTFPGETRNPLAFFQPWLRIDHAFLGPRLSTLGFVVESGRPSQHRAVALWGSFRPGP